MKVLVACERSGIVREAFRAGGHEAYSCDLAPAADGSRHHLQADVLTVLDKGWDLIIAHPPCTDIAVSGARYFAEKRADGRQQAAIDFFMKMVNAPAPRIAVENPVCIMSSVYRKPDQIIQPWQFGHDASKTTCLWLKGLQPLTPTSIINPHYACRKCGYRFDYALGKYGCPNCSGDAPAARMVWGNQTKSGQNRLGPSPDRAIIRSQTYQGIAEAMAEQWGKDETA